MKLPARMRLFGGAVIRRLKVIYPNVSANRWAMSPASVHGDVAPVMGTPTMCVSHPRPVW